MRLIFVCMFFLFSAGCICFGGEVESVSAASREAGKVAVFMRQSKSIELLSETIEGDVLVCADINGRIRWQTFSPYESILIFDGKELSQYEKLSGGWKKLSAHSRESVKKIISEISKLVVGDYSSYEVYKSGGKNFNNIKSALNAVFRLTLLDSGMDESPFAKIPNRSLSSKHQRPFTEAEFVRIYRAAPEPWKTAVLIAWFTGLRQKDVFLLRWDQIQGDVLTTTPAKTARFGRAVQIPIHPQLAEVLKNLSRCGERVLGAWEYDPKSISFRRAFGHILRSLGIVDNVHGKVVFNSLRDSFITRCDEAGVPRHAIRGIVGHRKDNMTDLYSHDLKSARQVQRLPRVKLE